VKLLAANVLPICFLASCVWFVWSGHPIFGSASLILAAFTAHTYAEKEK
jgi:hypothetical protein